MGCFGEGGVVLTSAEGGVFWRTWCGAHFSRGWGVLAKVVLRSLQPKVGCSGEGVVAVLIPAKGGAFWRRCCAPYSRGWRLLAKVLCSLQPKVGCFGEGGVVLAPAEIGEFWRRCRCATPIQSWRCCGEGVVAVLTPSKGGRGGGRSVLAKVVWLRSTQWGI